MYLRKVCNHPYAGLAVEQLNTYYFYLLEEGHKLE